MTSGMLLIVIAAGLAVATFGLTPSNISTSQKFTRAAERGAIVFIDVENVRGKSGFELSHANVIDSSSIWASSYGLEGRVSLIVDHGSSPNGYYMKEKKLGVIFSGKAKADDVIVRDIPFCQGELCRDVLVVTADTELIQRCKRAAQRSGGKELQVVKPHFFLENLEEVVKNAPIPIEEEKNDAAEDSNTLVANDSPKDETTLLMEAQVSLGARLIAVETQLRPRKNMKRMSPKKRKKLGIQARKLRSKLGLSGPSSIDKVTNILSKGDALDSSQQRELLEKWQSIRRSSGRKEVTGDRVLLAEGLRRELETITPPQVFHASDANFDAMDPAEAHACYANTLIYGMPEDAEIDTTASSATAPTSLTMEEKETLRVVIISDTHGCEKSLTTDYFEPWLFTNGESDNNGGEEGHKDETIDSSDEKIVNKLPDGDILLHLGDFAIDKGGVARRNALDRFDKWLSLQPHPIKIVVRGNHDPYTAQFPLSNAAYITKPTEFEFGDKVMACVPYGHGGFSSKYKRSTSSLLPSTCDILATHEPPKNILDRCLSGEKAGSSSLRTAVENMKGLPPKLWVCGHIHESRGAVRTTFGTKRDTRETLIINASNANPGRANHLVYGPIVVDVSSKDEITDGSKKPIAQEKRTFRAQKREKQEGEQELLLAIDLGLRCGASLFDDTGKLLRYEQLRFADEEDLHKRAPELIDSWRNDINADNKIDSNGIENKNILSYLAVEGGGHLFDAWESSLDSEDKKDIQLVSVRPEEWRSHLLTPKERASSRSCKEAARLIARQVVSDFGLMGDHQGRFKTDAAESVAMGYFMANHLGWIERKPLISRYSNGKVIVPR